MNDTTQDVPAPQPEPAPKTEKKLDKFFGTVGATAVVLAVVLVITDWLGFTQFYSHMKTAFAPPAKAVVAMSEKKAEVPKAEVPTPQVPAPIAATPIAATSASPVAPACNAQDAKPTVVVNCCPAQQFTPKPATKPASKPAPKPTPEAPKAKEVVMTPPPERIWLWHAHDATASNPKPCIIEYGDGRGLPPYCSSLKSVIPRIDGETKHQWLVRVGGGHRPTDTPLYQKKD